MSDDRRCIKPQLDYAGARQVLRDAADFIEKNGWCRYSLVGPDGDVCVIGAINSVSSYENGVLALKLLWKYIGDTVSVGHWNDNICRNKAEAIKTLIGAANS